VGLPSRVRHHPVTRWVRPEKVVALAEAPRIGFAGVMSGPLVRSSYRAGHLRGHASTPARGRDGQPLMAPPAEAMAERTEQPATDSRAERLNGVRPV